MNRISPVMGLYVKNSDDCAHMVVDVSSFRYFMCIPFSSGMSSLAVYSVAKIVLQC